MSVLSVAAANGEDCHLWPCRHQCEGTGLVTMQVAVVRYLVGGPSAVNAENLAWQDAQMAIKTYGTVLLPDLVVLHQLICRSC